MNQLLVEASNDAAAINDNDLHDDSIMSNVETYRKFPGHVKLDQRVYDHLLGGKWH